MFAEYLGFLSTNRDGISVFFAGAFFFVVLLQWLFWIFGVGRFKGHEVSRNLNLRYIFSDAAVKIINDFRHLLALILVLVFAAALAWVLIHAGDMDEIKEGMQTVVATLGGLIGSIIGYYFGESSAKQSPVPTKSSGDVESTGVNAAIQQRPPEEKVERAPPPPMHQASDSAVTDVMPDK